MGGSDDSNVLGSPSTSISLYCLCECACVCVCVCVYGVPDREVSGAEYIWDPEKQSKTAWTNELHCFDLNTSKFQSKVKPTAALYYCYEEYYMF